MSFRDIAPQNNSIVLRFGGGYHSRASEDEIQPTEASDGKNFDLDLENSHFKPRKPLKLLGTATNTSDIRGFAQLVKQDGSISTLIQAGTTVYAWDGDASWTSKGTVGATAKLRGHLHHNFTLDEKVIITDLSLVENVAEWDGTTFQDLTHNLGGNLLARYAQVSDERLWLANVKSGTATPHMLVGSKRSDMSTLSVSDVPSSALGADDAFYLLTPDLRPINGLTEAFGRFLFSSLNGSMFTLNGVDASNFSVSQLFARSAATGDEGMTYGGNDVIYGRAGVIETLAGAETFGDVENDDYSKSIRDQIEDYEKFRLVFNSRTKKLYVFPDGSDTIWVFHKSIHDQLAKDVTLLRANSQISPWVPYTTSHSAGFQPTTVWTMLDPSSKLQKVYMGDSSGNVYEFDGDTYDGDGGTPNIVTERTSMNYPIPSGKSFYVTGWVRYRSGADITLNLTFEFGGDTAYDQKITMTLPASGDAIYFGGDAWFAGSVYWGAVFGGRLVMQKYSAAGQGSEFKVRVSATTTNDFSIAEIGIEFKG